MSDEAARIVLAADYSQTDGAALSLDRLAQSGAKAEAATKRTGEAARESASKIQSAAVPLANMEQSYRRAAAGLDLTAKQMRAAQAASLGLSRQFTDIAVQVGSGGSIFMALGQQLPQIADQMAVARGQGVGLGQAMGALVGSINPLTVALGLTAGAALAAVAAWNEADKAAAALDNAATGLGRTAGLTGAQLNALAEEGARLGDVTTASARQQIAAYVSTGRIGGEMARNLISLSRDYATAFGVDAAEATEDLAKAMQSPDKAGRDLTRTMGLLTQEQLRQIDSMVRVGDLAGAQGVLYGELDRVLDGHRNKVGETASAWDDLASGIRNAWSALGDWLKIDTSEQMDRLRGQIARMDRAGAAGADPRLRARLQADLGMLEYREMVGGWDAEYQGRIGRQNQAAQDAADRAERDRRSRRTATPGMSEAERAYTATIDASRRLVEQLERETATYGMTADQILRYEAAQQVARLAADGWTQEEIGLARAIMDGTEALIARQRLLTEDIARPEAVTLRPLDVDFVRLAPELDVFAQELREIDQIAVGLGESLARSFGQSGQAIGDLVGSITNYRASVAELFAAAGDDERKRSKAVETAGRMELQLYGDLAASSRQFFDERSTAYQVLQAVEVGYRAWETASALASIVTDTAVTQAKIANSAKKTAASTAAGAATIFEQLGTFAFPVVGAMLALLGGLGGGGGSTASAPTLPRTNSGTGTVLGDPTAQSASIANALDRAERYQVRDLDISGQMLRALRSIDAQIGSVTTAISRELGVGGGLNTAGLNLGTTTSGGFLGIGATTRTTALADQGLNLNAGTLADLIANGVTGSLYQIIETTRTRSGFLGIGGSTRTSLNETSTGIDGGLSGELGRLLGTLRTGVLTAAGVVGVQGAEALLDSFRVEIGRISFEGLSSAEINDRLSSVFSALGDDLANAALPGLTRFQRAGEGAFETLSRLATEYQAIDGALAAIGQSFRLVGLESLDARARLLDLSGGLDAFLEGTDAFAQAFLTDAQRIAPVQAAVTAELTRLGVAADISRTGFADLVLGLDVSTEAGAAMYASLIRLAPALDRVIGYQDDLAASAADAAQALRQQAIETANAAVEAARSDLTSAYEREANALRDTESRFRSFASSLAAFRQSLEIDNGIGGVGYGAARSRFNDVAALAALGNEQALGDLQGVSQAYLEQSRAYAKDSLSYLRDLSAVKVALQRAESTASRTASNAQMQLAALDASVAGLITLNTSVLSVREAITRLQAALTGQAALSGSAVPSWAREEATAGRDFGANPAFAMGLANLTGYTGSFADPAAFESWILNQSESVRRAARSWYSNFDLVPAFAEGGVFTSPTLFRMGSQVGQMAEAGPEAIMPLVSGPNGLGVRASGGDRDMEALRTEVAELKTAILQVVTNTGRTARASERSKDVLERVTEGGDAMVTRAA